MKCFYHSGDLDGKCSAAIVLKDHPKVELFPINYGDPFPWDAIDPEETVWMVDFSLQPFSDMLRLQELAGEFIWIDHHATSIADRDKAGVMFNGVQREGRGACALVWEFIYPGLKLPQGVRLLAEYDVWDHSDPDALPFQHGMRNEPNDPRDFVWRSVFSLLAPRSIMQTGLTIQGFVERDAAIKAKTLCFQTTLQAAGEYYDLLAASYGPANSQFFDSLWDPRIYHAMCLFFWKPKIKQWVVGLYTTREDVYVGNICKYFGGGGHAMAAGFTCEILPFDLRGKKRPDVR